MAAPVDAARVATNIATAATSHAINVGSPVAGTLLIVYVRFAAAPGTVGFTGYTQLVADTSDATDDDTRIYWRWADGAEGATDTLTTTNSVKLAALAWGITGARNEAPAISAVAFGSTAANIANPGSVAPAGAPQDTLYLALAGVDGEVGAFTAAPTNYTNLVAGNSGTGGAAATNVLIGGASRQISASASDDPAAFTHAGGSTGWTAFALAIREPAPPETAYGIQVLADTPVAWYRMNEASGLIQDASGNTNHATGAVGSPNHSQASLIASDTAHTAIGFVAADGDGFLVSDHATLDQGDVFTVEAWIKPTSLGSYRAIFWRGGPSFYFGLYNDLLYLGIPDLGAIVTSTVSLTVGQTYHLVATKNGVTVKLYVNGVDVTGTVTNRTATNSTTPLCIGHWWGGGHHIDGVLDELAVYATALSAARVLAHYEAAAAPPLDLPLADTLALADSFTSESAFNLAPTDSLALVDSLGLAAALDLPLADSLALADLFDGQLGVGLTLDLADPLALSDVFDGALAVMLPLDLADSLGLADLLSTEFILPLDLADAAGLVDALSLVEALDLAATDTLPLTDLLDSVLGVGHTLSLADTASLEDSLDPVIGEAVFNSYLEYGAIVNTFIVGDGTLVGEGSIPHYADPEMVLLGVHFELGLYDTLEIVHPPKPSLVLNAKQVEVSGSVVPQFGSPVLVLRGKAFASPLPIYTHMGKAALLLRGKIYVLGLSNIVTTGKLRLILRGKRLSAGVPGLMPAIPLYMDLVPTVAQSVDLVPATSFSGNTIVGTVVVGDDTLVRRDYTRDLVPTVEEFR